METFIGFMGLVHLDLDWGRGLLRAARNITGGHRGHEAVLEEAFGVHSLLLAVQPWVQEGVTLP